MNSKIAFAVIAALLSSQVAMAKTVSTNITRSGQANETTGKVVSGKKALKASAKKSSSGVKSADAAASAGASAFGKSKPAGPIGSAKPVVAKPAAQKTVAAPAPKAPAQRITKDTKSGNGAAQTPAQQKVAEITSLGLDTKLNGKSAELGKAIESDSYISSKVDETLAAFKKSDKSAESTQAAVNAIEGILNLSKEDKAIRNTEAALGLPSQSAGQSYVGLVNASIEAISWKASTSRSKAIAAVESVNTKIASGKSIETAMNEVSKEMSISLEDLKKLCGKKA